MPRLEKFPYSGCHRGLLYRLHKKLLQFSYLVTSLYGHGHGIKHRPLAGVIEVLPKECR